MPGRPAGQGASFGLGFTVIVLERLWCEEGQFNGPFVMNNSTIYSGVIASEFFNQFGKTCGYSSNCHNKIVGSISHLLFFGGPAKIEWPAVGGAFLAFSTGVISFRIRPAIYLQLWRTLTNGLQKVFKRVAQSRADKFSKFSVPLISPDIWVVTPSNHVIVSVVSSGVLPTNAVSVGCVGFADKFLCPTPARFLATLKTHIGHHNFSSALAATKTLRMTLTAFVNLFAGIGNHRQLSKSKTNQGYFLRHSDNVSKMRKKFNHYFYAP